MFGGRLDVGFFVYGVELAARDGIGESLGGSLDAFEEGIVLGLALSGFLVGMMLKDFLAVGLLDLLVCGAVAVFAEPEDGIVVLSLCDFVRMMVDWKWGS